VSDLTSFILARTAEDEAFARSEAVLRDGDPYYSTEAGAFERYFDPARGLAECEAKRRIMEECADLAYSEDVYTHADLILAALALPYADHPGYREEWRS